MNRAKLKIQAKEAIQGRIFTIFALSILVTIVVGVISFIPVAGSLAALLIAGPLAFAWCKIYLGILQSKEQPKVDDLLSGFKDDNFMRTFVGYLRIAVFTFLWSLLFVIPGIVKAISYSQMFYLMAKDKELDAAKAQVKSMEMMQGYKMEYFILQLSFIPWFLLCGITFGLAGIYVMPYYNTTLAAFHEKLANKKSE